MRGNIATGNHPASLPELYFENVYSCDLKRSDPDETAGNWSQMTTEAGAMIFEKNSRNDENCSEQLENRRQREKQK